MHFPNFMILGTGKGGTTALYPEIYELVDHCAKIGLSPTIITNAQVLSNRAATQRFRKSGLRDFLLSIQGLGAVYDEIVGQQRAHVRQMKALRNLQVEGIPFRFNTVLSKPVLDQGVDIAQLAISMGAEVRPIAVGGPVSDPQYFSRQQAKKIHPEDMDWLHTS